MAYSGPQWEFRVVVLENPYDAAERQLNDLGLEGWQLVTVIDSGIAFLQRRYIEALTGPRPPPRLPATEDQ